MADEVLITLGSFTFSMAGVAYDRLSRQLTARWPAAPRAGRSEALQFGGTDAETLTLAGRIYPHYRGGLGQISAMRELLKSGEPQMLTDGLGTVWGKFAITAVEEEARTFTPDGAPLRQDFRLELKAYGEDQ
jgi:phage protein U